MVALWNGSGVAEDTLVFDYVVGSNDISSGLSITRYNANGSVVTGAFDSVSVVIRGTILQIMPPDHLRGRVVSVNGIFLAASNELGAFESGLAARLLGTVPSVIFGGTLTLLTVLYVWRRSKQLFAVKLV